MSAVANENFLVENWKYLLAALAMHAVIVVALTVTIDSTRQSVIPSQLAIKAVVIDNSAKRLQREKQQAAQAEAERVAREQAEAEEKAREQLAIEKREAEKLAIEKKREEQALQVKQQEDQRQKAAVEQKRKADEKQAAVKRQADEKKRAAEIKTKQAEQQKSERDAREQAQRESELKRQLADEEGRLQAENSGLLNQYAALIEQRVVRNWNKPASAKQGIQCEVKVTQAQGGTVLSVQVLADKCNGDAAVRQSIEAAVYRSSPLPMPPDSRLFQRVIVFVFKPTE
jgi:colicin import membrane protein